MTGYYGYELNWIGIVLAALTPTLIGAIWYHPKAFGKAWMESLGFTEADLKRGNMAITLGISFLMSLTLAYYFAMRYHAHGEESSVRGACCLSRVHDFRLFRHACIGHEPFV